MPEKVSYGGTITFNPNYSLGKKEKLIEQFPLVLSQHLSYKGDKNYYICISKEYHKVEQEDDFEAPHLHFILVCEGPLPNLRVNGINAMFKEKYGRSQFYRMTKLKEKQYAKYIMKDSERLYQLTGKPHYVEHYLEEPQEDYYDDDYLIEEDTY